MNDVWQSLIGIAAGLIACWLILLAVLALARPRGNLLTEAVHLLPDLLRLVSRLARDLPRRTRWLLWLLVGYQSVPLPAQIAFALKAHMEEFRPVEVTLPWGKPDGEPKTFRLLFVDTKGRAYNRSVFNMGDWKRALAAAGVIPLGHSDPGFTLRTYTHLLPSSETRTRKAIDDAFAEAEAADDGDPVAAQGTSVPSPKPMCPQCALAA